MAWDPLIFSYLAVAFFGGAVGSGELVARYRDAPASALLTRPAMTYIAINAATACAALWIILDNNWTFGEGEGALSRQVLVAGFGAMAFFRSALFTVRVGDNDVQVGPSAFLQIILGAADRAVDRSRAEHRTAAVREIMGRVSFEKAQEALTSHCFALMQNLSGDEVAQIAQTLEDIGGSNVTDEVKSLNLGLLLMNYVGDDVLRAAVAALGDQIIRDALP